MNRNGGRVGRRVRDHKCFRCGLLGTVNFQRSNGKAYYCTGCWDSRGEWSRTK